MIASSPSFPSLADPKYSPSPRSPLASIPLCWSTLHSTDPPCTHTPGHVDEVGREGHLDILPGCLAQALLNLRHVAVLSHLRGVEIGLGKVRSESGAVWQACGSLAPPSRCGFYSGIRVLGVTPPPNTHIRTHTHTAYELIPSAISQYSVDSLAARPAPVTPEV